MVIKLLSTKGNIIQKECKSIKKVEKNDGTYYKLTFDNSKPELFDAYVWKKVCAK